MNNGKKAKIPGGQQIQDWRCGGYGYAEERPECLCGFIMEAVYSANSSLFEDIDK